MSQFAPVLAGMPAHEKECGAIRATAVGFVILFKRGAAEEQEPLEHEHEPVQALLIGGRAGVGKSTLGWEISAQLQEAAVGHAFVEGDNLDQIFPAPAQDPSRSMITEANLAAMWGNYAAAGCRRLIYTNTVSVLEPDLIVRALGGDVRVIAVLLTASDDTARARLEGREIGSQLEPHVERGARTAVYLERTAPSSVLRVETDGRTVGELARSVIGLTGWLAFSPRGG